MVHPFTAGEVRILPTSPFPRYLQYPDADIFGQLDATLQDEALLAVLPEEAEVAFGGASPEPGDLSLMELGLAPPSRAFIRQVSRRIGKSSGGAVVMVGDALSPMRVEMAQMKHNTAKGLKLP